MNKRIWIWRRLAGTVLVGGMLLQIGPCDGDSFRDAVGSGARATLDAIFGTVTDALVTGLFNLP